MSTTMPSSSLPEPTSDGSKSRRENGSVESRISATADSWKRKLLDLTKRNRALNFRVNKVSTIAVVDEKPAEVFRHIYIRERAMKFEAAPDENPEAEAAGAREVIGARSDGDDPVAIVPVPELDWSDGEADGSDDVVAADFSPYDPADLDGRHTDDRLQTSSSPEALDRSLRRLDEQARLSIEEQGVNTLFLALGMLHYRESVDSDVEFRAPLVLLPVQLSRSSARSGYTVRAAEDEPLVNPALAEYLRRDHGLALPELPESSAMPDDYDLQPLLEQVSSTVADKAGWSVKTSIYLAQFSFQKFVMYKDLEANRDLLLQHRLIRQLVTRTSQGEVQMRGLPRDVSELELDRDYAPEATHQVVDADSSQLRAIAAAARNHDLVIEGPPGTGKSQTITNLIAQALAAGKSVLFVAEKMAALSVVHERLVRAKLGEFCLELHSTKANKRAVMRELGAALDASLKTVAAPAGAGARLPHVRATLTDYAKAVHAPFGTLNLSPYQAFGELGRVLAAPRVKYHGSVDGDVSLQQLEQVVRDLNDLAVTAAEIGVPDEHPWRDTRRTFYTADDLESVRELASELVAKLEDVVARAAAVGAAFGLASLATFAEVEASVAVADVLARSPGASLAVLASPAWNQAPSAATDLIERGRALDELEARVSRAFSRVVLEQEHGDDIAYVERKSQGISSLLAFLDGRYRAIKKRWLGYRQPGFKGSLIEQANEMKHVDRLRAERRALTDLEDRGRELFGALWRGERSDWGQLESYVAWVVEFRAIAMRHELREPALLAATHPAPDVSRIGELRAAVAEVAESLERLRTAVRWPDGHLADAPFASILERSRALVEHVRAAPKWAAFEAARQVAAASPAGELLPLGMNGELTFPDLAPAFLRAFYSKWLSLVVESRPPLQRFNTLPHEQRVQEFCQLDERVLHENRGVLVGALRDRLQETLRRPEIASQMPYLRRELARQRGLSPLRKTMRQAGEAVRAIKPCFMMSPLTVAQLLDGSAPPFDLIIFDEASQLPAEDAAGAIIRGEQLVVVGDPKQLPPTNFFSVSSGTGNVELDEDGQPLVEDSESILEEFMGAGVPMSRLKWHYRSAHESLISFSNVQFYEADLYTFPSVETGNGSYGLQFEHVPNGVYEGKGLNAVEARRVADEVVRFAKEQVERRSRGEGGQSLGVGTFNLRQQLAILDELEQRRRDDPSIEWFFDRTANEPFFVKNLENIQGDERDVIFLSVTYAKATDGKLRYNFGPLNGENGWRRLNVLTTRARKRMKVFSSMRGDEINAAATTSRGANLLREFLVFAERGRLESVSASMAAQTESPFEADVLRALTERGVTVLPQVGMAGYRIDLAVLDDELPGRFLCGIECDGVAYHASETARDRDRLRQQVLEARGWVIHRVWSTDWFKDRPGQIERLLKLIDATRARAREEAETAEATRARAAAEAERRAEEEAEAARREAAELVSASDGVVPYVRPAASAYVAASSGARYGGLDLLQAALPEIVETVDTVIRVEAPIHAVDLFTRVASLWGTRAGSRIQARIREACDAAEQARILQRRGDFYWSPEGTCELRSRAGTRIPAGRVAPEEYRQAVLAVLGTGHGFSRADLTTEVRSVLGYSRTGALLDEAIGAAIDQLRIDGQIGEASTGIRLRRRSVAGEVS